MNYIFGLTALNEFLSDVMIPISIIIMTEAPQLKPYSNIAGFCNNECMET